MYPCTQTGRNVVLTECLLPMADGVKLYTRIVVPKNAGKCPVVFMRTPYEQEHQGQPHDLESYEDNNYIRHGYAVILQHTRGHGDSEGYCLPYVERQDGLATLEHIRKMPFYNGEIYVTGASYTATVHYAYLGDNPPDVRGAALAVQSDRVYANRYRNGCCMNFANAGWWGGMIGRQHPIRQWDGALKRPYKDIFLRAMGENDPRFSNILMHPEFDEAWVDERTWSADHMTMPTLFLEGWFDFYLDGMFSVWERLPAQTREKSAFVVGPWAHATWVGTDGPYPLENGNLPGDFVLDWFESIRYGRPYSQAKLGQMRYYAMGEKKWFQGEWPCWKTGMYACYLRPDGTMGSKPGEYGKREYVYDPTAKENEDGCLQMQDVDYCHMFQLRQIDQLPEGEGVSFTMEPVSERIGLLGHPRWQMKVCSDCEDTAFFIRICLVEDGKAFNLTETMVPLHKFAPQYVPGEVATLDVELPVMAVVLLPGQSLRVDIASHGGCFVPHANVRGHWAEVTQTKVAHNTLILDDEAKVVFPMAEHPGIDE